MPVLDWFMELNPYLSGLLLSIIIGLPTGLSIVETLREDAGQPKQDDNAWDNEWDLK